MDVVVSVVGAVVIVGVVRDVFHTLLHPSGQGRLSSITMTTVWRLTAYGGSRPRELAGPVALAVVILAWVVLTVMGWAMVWWPHMPDGFVHSSGLDVSGRNTFTDAVYLSLVTVTTLGYGDVVPAATGLRILAPLEAFMGFAILTAAVSWVLQIQPAVVRRRTFVLGVSAMRRAGLGEAVGELDAELPADVLTDLASSVAQLHVDLTEYSETYYFREGDAGMAPALRFAADLARAGQGAARPDVRLAARTLQAALDDVAAHIGETFLDVDGDTDEVLRALERDRSKQPRR